MSAGRTAGLPSLEVGGPYRSGMPDDVLPIADKVLTPITALGLAVARVGAHIIPARRG